MSRLGSSWLKRKVGCEYMGRKEEGYIWRRGKFYGGTVDVREKGDNEIDSFI
jgi:hypothetical protein